MKIYVKDRWGECMENKYNISRDFKVFVQMSSRGPKNMTGEEAIRSMANNSVMGRRVWKENATDDEVKVTKFMIPSFDETQIEIQIIEPHELPEQSPCLMYYHGGAFVVPALDFHKRLIRAYAMGARCKVVYVDYRLAFEYPFPIGLEDSYSALEWIVENAKELGIDKNRIAVAGDSSGGTLATAVAQMARDRMHLKLCLQLLCYPATDCNQNTASMKEFIDTPVWNTPMNNYMWEIYLRDGLKDIRNGKANMLPYASPMATTNFENLPPAYIELTEFDPVRDEGKAYGELLKAHGVNVTLYQSVGTVHGYDAVKNSKITKENIQRRIEALKAAFNI